MLLIDHCAPSLLRPLTGGCAGLCFTGAWGAALRFTDEAALNSATCFKSGTNGHRNIRRYTAYSRGITVTVHLIDLDARQWHS